jgi:hypothetical protein
MQRQCRKMVRRATKHIVDGLCNVAVCEEAGDVRAEVRRGRRWLDVEAVVRCARFVDLRCRYCKIWCVNIPKELLYKLLRRDSWVCVAFIVTSTGISKF